MAFQPLLCSFLALSSIVVASPVPAAPAAVATQVYLGQAQAYTLLAKTGLSSTASDIIGNVGKSNLLTIFF